MEDNPPSLGNLRLLPGEIRNIIYDLATLPETEPIALLRANLRSLYGPLLLVSRQFHQEAYQFYREACLRFWTDHDFEVILPSYVPGAKDKAIKDTSNIIRTVGKIRDADLQQIRNLTVRTPRQVFTLHDAAGLWRISSRLSGHIGNQWTSSSSCKALSTLHAIMDKVTEQTSKLFTLPAELRNEIYELVLGMVATGADVWLCRPRSPGYTLLHICREIRQEASQMHQRRREEYWSSNKFFYHMASAKDLAKVIQTVHSMRPSDLSMIKRLEFSVHLTSRRSGRFLTRTRSLIDQCGLWKTETVASSGPREPTTFNRVITKSFAQSLEQRPAQVNLGPTSVVAMKDQVLLMLLHLSAYANDLADPEAWCK